MKARSANITFLSIHDVVLYDVGPIMPPVSIAVLVLVLLLATAVGDKTEQDPEKYKQNEEQNEVISLSPQHILFPDFPLPFGEYEPEKYKQEFLDHCC